MTIYRLDDVLCGATDVHLVLWQNTTVHRALVEPLNALQRAAAAAGFDLAVASGARSFDRQLAIWNDKAEGRRPVLDDAGRPLDLTAMTAAARVRAILRFSALPGTSRHHWGTDVDVYDRAALPPNYRLQLTPAECAPGGVLGEFHDWLSNHLASHFDFHRPYKSESVRGVAAEPWHLSHAPLARPLEAALHEGVVARRLATSELALKATVLSMLPAIFTEFVRVPPAPGAAPR